MLETIPHAAAVGLAMLALGLGAGGALATAAAMTRRVEGAAWFNRAGALPFGWPVLGLAAAGMAGAAVAAPFLFPALVVFTVVAACLHAGLEPFGAVGLRRGGWVAVAVLPPLAYLALLIPVAVSNVVSRGVLTLAGWEVGPQPALLAFQKLDGAGEIMAFAFLAVVVAPFAEEMFFRGFLHGSLKRRLPVPVAAAASSLLFGAVHFHPPTFAALVVLGFGLALLYEATGSLWSAVVAHAIFNAVTLAVALAFPEILA